MCKEQPETAEDPWCQLDFKDADPLGLLGSRYPSVIKTKGENHHQSLLSWGRNLELTWTLPYSHKLDGDFCRETLC